MQQSKAIDKVLFTLHFTLAMIWIYQGSVPKLMFHAPDEQRLWELHGLDELAMLMLVDVAGWIEIIFGALFLLLKQRKILHYFNIAAMLGLSIFIVLTDVTYFQQAFNPFVMNLAMATLSVVAIQLMNIQHNPNITS